MIKVKELISTALQSAKSQGAQYADVRIIKEKHESLTVKNAELDELTLSEGNGFGIRVIHSNNWGFAASNKLEKDEILKVSKRAVEIAKASALIRNQKVKLAPVDVIQDSYQTEVKINPFNISIEKKLNILFEAEKLLRKNKAVKIGQAKSDFFQTEKIFANSEGSYITQKITESGGGLKATAISDGDVEVRSYPNSHGGGVAAAGFEFIENLGLVENAQRIGDEAAALLKARQCPSFETDVILDGSQLALQIHESLGHPTELDRVLGTEISYAGGSFLSLDKLGKFKYGSKIVNIYSDATIKGALGTFGYDDEGVRAQKFDLVKNGVLVGYSTSRETAKVINGRPNGTMRAESWGAIPLIRMTNISLKPGNIDLDDLISDTKDGVYLETNKSWSIDDLRLNFQFATEVGWRIKKGKKVELLKGCNYAGITPKFWNSCDAITNDNYWQIWGLPNCGKGQPSQIAHVAHGASPARFRKVNVGVGG